MLCCALLCVQSSFAIILMGNRELVVLHNLSSWCLVIVLWLFLEVPWVCLWLWYVLIILPYYFWKQPFWFILIDRRLMFRHGMPWSHVVKRCLACLFIYYLFISDIHSSFSKKSEDYLNVTGQWSERARTTKRHHSKNSTPLHVPLHSLFYKMHTSMTRSYPLLIRKKKQWAGRICVLRFPKEGIPFKTTSFMNINTCRKYFMKSILVTFRGKKNSSRKFVTPYHPFF